MRTVLSTEATELLLTAQVNILHCDTLMNKIILAYTAGTI